MEILLTISLLFLIYTVYKISIWDIKFYSVSSNSLYLFFLANFLFFFISFPSADSLMINLTLSWISLILSSLLFISDELIKRNHKKIKEWLIKEELKEEKITPTDLDSEDWKNWIYNTFLSLNYSKYFESKDKYEKWLKEFIEDIKYTKYLGDNSYFSKLWSWDILPIIYFFLFIPIIALTIPLNITILWIYFLLSSIIIPIIWTLILQKVLYKKEDIKRTVSELKTRDEMFVLFFKDSVSSEEKDKLTELIYSKTRRTVAMLPFLCFPALSYAIYLFFKIIFL